MDIQSLLAELKQERDRMDQAISALEGLGQGGRSAVKRGRKGRRIMSPEARARISKAMKARWAQRKKSTT